MNAIRTLVVHNGAPRRGSWPARHRLLARFSLDGRSACVGSLAALGLASLAACTTQPIVTVSYPGLPKAADVALVHYSSCAQALLNLRAAATAAIGRGEITAGGGTSAGVPGMSGGVPGASGGVPGTSVGAPPAPSAPSSQSAGSSGLAGRAAGAPASGYYSGTNDAVPGVDEPDLIKTDGRRIVTVTGGVLRVVDAQTQQLTGALDLSSLPGLYGASPANLLLYGDHALVLLNSFYPVMMGPMPPSVGGTGSGTPGAPGASPAWGPIAGPRMLLVDLSAGIPRVISEYTIDGSLVDARQVGSVARVIVRSVPRLFQPAPQAGYQAGYGVAGNAAERTAVARAALSSWLPRYALTDLGVRRTGQVNCADVSHPAMPGYTGTSMLTVLTFDLSSDSLGDGQPVTIVADGDTVYSDGSSLYVANDQQPIALPVGISSGAVGPPALAPASDSTTTRPVQSSSVTSAPAGPAVPALPPQYVSLYKFGITGSGRPVYEASGTVPGWLLGSTGMTQYSLSQWNGVLRVATTTGNSFGYMSSPSQSAVYEVEQVDSELVIVGKVGGLGAGEQIYAVRFVGPVGYVVTFRQVDPLYTLDLSNPAQPRVAGELWLRGYSAYLDPIDATHLIGVGQATSAFGETLGTQVSLFDVSDLAGPVRQAVYYLRFGHSDAEFDPHAFLYWPLTRVVVIPVQRPYVISPVPQLAPGSQPPGSSPTAPTVLGWPTSSALVLHVGDHSITKIGMIRQPATPGWPGGGQILRSLVIGNELWTVSDAGLQANDLTTLAPVAWVPFD